MLFNWLRRGLQGLGQCGTITCGGRRADSGAHGPRWASGSGEFAVTVHKAAVGAGLHCWGALQLHWLPRQGGLCGPQQLLVHRQLMWESSTRILGRLDCGSGAAEQSQQGDGCAAPALRLRHDGRLCVAGACLGFLRWVLPFLPQCPYCLLPAPSQPPESECLMCACTACPAGTRCCCVADV